MLPVPIHKPYQNATKEASNYKSVSSRRSRLTVNLACGASKQRRLRFWSGDVTPKKKTYIKKWKYYSIYIEAHLMEFAVGRGYRARSKEHKFRVFGE